MERERERLGDLRVSARGDVREQRCFEDEVFIVLVVTADRVFRHQGLDDSAGYEAVATEVVDDPIELALEVQVRVGQEHAVHLRGRNRLEQ